METGISSISAVNVILNDFPQQRKEKTLMDNKQLSEVLHDLVAIQNTFRSYEQLANECFRFRPKEHFHKCVIKIQAVIDHGRELNKEEQNGAMANK